MKKIVFKILDDQLNNYILFKYDGYYWVINLDTQMWVLNISNSGYVWYNYDFFHNLFKYASLNVIEDCDYIKNWINNRLKIITGMHCYPDKHPKDYDWSHDFDEKTIHNVIKNGKFIRELQFSKECSSVIKDTQYLF